MFFADPVAAFANLHAQMVPGGGLTFACWQALKQNNWARAPMAAALPFLSEPPTAPPPGTPGPFAFEDADRTRALLTDAGWRDVTITPWTGKLQLSGDTIEDAAVRLTRFGPLSRVLEEQGVDMAPVQAALQTTLADFLEADGKVRMPAAAWIVTATA